MFEVSYFCNFFFGKQEMFKVKDSEARMFLSMAMLVIFQKNKMMLNNKKKLYTYKLRVVY